MNSTRLFVLASLARHGPMHGHQIRRNAQLERTELWTDIKPGSLYGALHRMADEGLITPVKTEQEGRLPARTVYEITQAGREELGIHRDKALRTTKLPHDPVDLALNFIEDLSEDQVRAVLTDRRTAYAAQVIEWQHLQERVDQYLTDRDRMGFRHQILRLQAEIAWHDEFLARLPGLLAD
ncbi:PadR family transcriptional regulator [Actinophytocola sp.]|uniref:PadR family transcriptional regulator n=1 Tax=Actinophytocola sp. TaxID=1872138 RepID=UPI002D7E835D|nr:PadR family transcriptional regulator [Actinophytocola sp.]HET9138106.1 PadR family transcriptional regulator [Actinophytocola sp.]